MKTLYKVVSPIAPKALMKKVHLAKMGEVTSVLSPHAPTDVIPDYMGGKHTPHPWSGCDAMMERMTASMPASIDATSSSVEAADAAAAGSELS